MLVRCDASATQFGEGDVFVVVGVQKDMLAGHAFGLAGASGEYVSSLAGFASAVRSGGGRVVGVLDAHPADHCSFCRNGTAESNPSGFLPSGGVCLLETDPARAPNRCTDALSAAAFAAGAYDQWPDNRVAGGSGSAPVDGLFQPDADVCFYKGYHPTQAGLSIWNARIPESEEATCSDSLSLPPVDELDNRPSLGQAVGGGGGVFAHRVERVWLAGVGAEHDLAVSLGYVFGTQEGAASGIPGGVEIVVVDGLVLPYVDRTPRSVHGVVAASKAGAYVVVGTDPGSAVSQLDVLVSARHAAYESGHAGGHAQAHETAEKRIDSLTMQANLFLAFFIISGSLVVTLATLAYTRETMEAETTSDRLLFSSTNQNQ